MKEARKAGNEAKLLRDKLYINGQLFRFGVANVENMNTEASTKGSLGENRVTNNAQVESTSKRLNNTLFVTQCETQPSL